MMRFLAIGLFLTVFISINFGMNYYAISRIFKTFNIQHNVIFYSLVLFLSFFYILGSILVRYFPGNVSKAIYTLAALWFGVVFILNVIFGVHHLIDYFFPYSYSGFIALGVAFLVISYGIFNAYSFDVVKQEIPIEGLKENKTIVFMSDLHAGTVRGTRYINDLALETNKAKPDAVLIAGDLIDGSGFQLNGLLKPLSKIKAPVFFANGNHEHYDGKSTIHKALEESNVKVLENEYVEVSGLQIVGLDDYDLPKDQKKAIDGINFDPNKTTILMNHRPTAYEHAFEKGVNLQVSGHTHNGQIIPFNLLVRIQYPKIMGLYRFVEGSLYVGPGTGTWGPPLRIGSRNELTVIKLVPTN